MLQHIDGARPVAATYHIGDLVGYAPWPDETVALLRERGIQGVAGNYDSTVAADYRHCGCKYENAEQDRQCTHVLNTVYWTEDRPDDFCRKMAALAGLRSGDVIAFGHTHEPWHRELDGIHFVNAGSVGRPKDKDSRACYVTVDFQAAVPEVAFARVDYDVERAARGVVESGLPVEFADQLRTG